MGDDGEGMSKGAVAGLCIGLIILILCLIILIIWLVRCRHYVSSQKHTKMPSDGEDIISTEAHNHLYMSHPHIDPNSHQSWMNGNYGGHQSDWNSHIPNASAPAWDSSQYPTYPKPHSNAFQTGPYSWVDSREPQINVQQIPTVFQLPNFNPHTGASAPYVNWSDEQNIGDLSTINQNPLSLYPRLPSISLESGMPQGPSDKQRPSWVNAENIRQKFRSKVQKVARVSQINMFTPRRSRVSQPSTRDSKRRGQRSRGSRKSTQLTSDLTDLGGRRLSYMPGEGYCNMDIASDNQGFADLRSLDNDNFLFSLENAVFPGITDAGSSATDSKLQPVTESSSSDPVNASSINQVGCRISLGADLSLGSGATSNTWRPLTSESGLCRRTRSGFRFPEPGPPVAGWAHKFSSRSNDTEVASPNSHETTLKTPRKSGETTIPPIPPPISPTAHQAKQVPQSEVLVSSAAVPRRRTSKSSQIRHRSEPRRESRRGTPPSSTDANSSEERSLSTSRNSVLSERPTPYRSPSFPEFYHSRTDDFVNASTDQSSSAYETPNDSTEH